MFLKHSAVIIITTTTESSQICKLQIQTILITLNNIGKGKQNLIQLPIYLTAVIKLFNVLQSMIQSVLLSLIVQIDDYKPYKYPRGTVELL